MAIQKQTLFINARLVGRSGIFAVLVTDGRIETIVEGEGPPRELWGGVELVDCRQADGSSLFISPVSHRCGQTREAATPEPALSRQRGSS